MTDTKCDYRHGLILSNEDTKTRLKECFALAIDMNRLTDFCRLIDRLTPDPTNVRSSIERTLLYPDWAPMSFGFTRQRYKHEGDNPDWVMVSNGGLIYHGPLPNGEKVETFSVELSPSD